FKTLTAAVALTAGLAFPAMAADTPFGKPVDPTAKPEKTLGRYTGFEGRERDLGLIMNMVVKTLEDNQGYQHEINDALVKQHLSHMQFLKDRNLVKEGVDEEIKTQSPMLKRAAKMIEKSGDKDMALKAVFDQTTCHWQLVLDTQSEPGMRRFKSPFANVLAQTTRMGQHDLTEKWIHENWTIPRMQGYSKILGVDLEVSPWQDDGMITVKVKDYKPAEQKTSAVTN
ncbi:MAG: hypothetical protein JNK21_05835, partial [Rhodospirillaceae bacterium]|nr:hypothetical protein [Rhodospirillaceae bacterium]